MKKFSIPPLAPHITKAHTFSSAARRICAASDTYRWYIFRTSFEAGEPIASAVLLLDAKYYAALYLNGRHAAYYVQRCYAFDKPYDVMDVSSFVCEGKNTVALLTHGFRGETAHDFRFQLELTYRSGKTKTVVSDESWGFLPYTALSENSNFFTISFGKEEVFDARLADPAVFSPNFDDEKLSPVCIVSDDGYVLRQSKMRAQTLTPCYPQSIPALCSYKNPCGYGFHIGPTSRSLSAFSASFAAEKEMSVVLRVTSGDAVFTLDGSEIRPDIPVSLSAGSHRFALYMPRFDASEPELFFETDGVLSFRPVSEASVFNRLFIPAFSVEYPWNEARPEAVVPDSFRTFVSARTEEELPESISSLLAPAEIRPLSHLHRLRTKTLLVHKEGTVSPRVLASFPHRESEAPLPISGAGSFLSDISPLVLHPDKTSDGAFLLFDFGGEHLGLLNFELSAPAGTQAEIHCFERLPENGIAFMGENNTLTYLAREGEQSYTAAVRRGFRYAALFLSGYNAPVTLSSFSLLEMRYDCKSEAPFSCDDPAVTLAYRTSARTAMLCMEDSYVDCPGYEQNVWTGDARVTANVGLVNFGSFAFDETYLRLVGQSLVEPYQTWQWGENPRFDSTGRYFTFACYPRYPRGGIPIWSFQWLLQTYDHYMATGDKEALADLFPYVCRQLENCFELTDSRGLFAPAGAWNLIEWAENDLLACGEATANNAMLISCLNTAAEEADILGDAARAALFREKAKSYTDALNAYCWDEEAKAYTDSVTDEYAYGLYTEFYNKKGKATVSFEEFSARKRISVQTNTLVYLSGAAKGEREALCTRFITDNIDSGVYRNSTPAKVIPGPAGESSAPRGYIPVGSPFFLFFVFKALAKLGRHDLILKSVRRDWGRMAEECDTCHETFSCGGQPTRSIAHAWSASPAVFLQTEILGIKPLEPGYRRFTVTPHLCSLKNAKGGVTTPFGVISAEASVDETGKISVTVTAPEACEWIKK